MSRGCVHPSKTKLLLPVPDGFCFCPRLQCRRNSSAPVSAHVLQLQWVAARAARMALIHLRVHAYALQSAPRGKGPLTHCDSKQSLAALNLSPHSWIQRSSETTWNSWKEKGCRKQTMPQSLRHDGKDRAVDWMLCSNLFQAVLPRLCGRLPQGTISILPFSRPCFSLTSHGRAFPLCTPELPGTSSLPPVARANIL